MSLDIAAHPDSMAALHDRKCAANHKWNIQIDESNYTLFVECPVKMFFMSLKHFSLFHVVFVKTCGLSTSTVL